MRSNIIFAEPHAITLDESGLVAASEPSIKARGKAYGTGRKGSIEWKDGDLYWNQYGIYSDDTEITEGATLVFARVLKTSIVGPETVSSGEYGDLRFSGSDVYKLGQAGTSLKTASATSAADDRPGYLPGQPWRASGTGPQLSYRRKGIRQYELTDHLGNVRAVIGDRLKTETLGTATAYKPELLSATDYFPFGMQMPERVVVDGEGYRYGFNGMEKENAVNEDGYTTAFRDYNTWRGAWTSQDPLQNYFAPYSPYNFVLNNPLYWTDPDGLFPVRKGEKISRAGERNIFQKITNKTSRGRQLKEPEKLERIITYNKRESLYMGDYGSLNDKLGTQELFKSYSSFAYWKSVKEVGFVFNQGTDLPGSNLWIERNSFFSFANNKTVWQSQHRLDTETDMMKNNRPFIANRRDGFHLHLLRVYPPLPSPAEIAEQNLQDEMDRRVFGNLIGNANAYPDPTYTFQKQIKLKATQKYFDDLERSGRAVVK
jgi:RHS repeat-associated protein